MEFRVCFFLVVGLSLQNVCVFSFNLDFRIPVVKRQDSDSYFGFSVAGHQEYNGGTGDYDSWLLVGAPRGRNLQPMTNRSGALFKCPLTSLDDDCVQVVTDGKRDKDGVYDASNSVLEPPNEDEFKEDQWMGVTVKSQGKGGQVLVCAHRYIFRGQDKQAMWGYGLCYILKQNFEHHSRSLWVPCRNRPMQKAHEEYGYCQVGTSGALMDDEVMVGSPGPYTWRGTMFLTNISSDYLHRDKTIYMAPVLDPNTRNSDDTSPVDKYSYLGMSVAGGRFFGGTKTLYAAGAPRANGSLGQVALFSKRGRGYSVMQVRLLLTGEQFASSFGYEVAALDVDGDGQDDLAVGAPFNFTRYTGGGVYIYRKLTEYCSAERECCNCPQKIAGVPESRFGFAIANAGDLNKDSYHDLAVGAPYEDEGAIYIYLGSRKGLLESPAQVVRPKDLPWSVSHGMTAFGHALSGGLDLDHNSYPDLLAGAYESDRVVLLRARPIVDISTSVGPPRDLTNIDHQQRGCRARPSAPYACFSFKACCKVAPIVKAGRGSAGGWVALNYTLEAETFVPERKFSRVWFEVADIPPTARPHVVRRDIAVPSGQEHCQDEVVFVKEGITDIQSPIRFRLTYKLVQREPAPPRPGQPLPRIDDYPILNQQEAAKTFEAHFQKDCGDNDICESQLFLVAHLLLPHARQVNTSELVLGRHHNVTLNVTAYNLNESAYSARLFISHPRSLNYTRYKSTNQQMSCQPANATMVQCALGNPFKRDKSINFLVMFDPRDIREDEDRFTITTFANSTSMESSPQPPAVMKVLVVRKAEMTLTGLSVPDRLLYGGEAVGESAVRSQEQAGTRVVHVFKLYNAGPWVARNVEVRIEWPHQVGNNKPLGKWLLYLAEPLRLDVEGGGECTPSEGVINPLKLVPESEANTTAEPPPERTKRSKRDIEMVIAPESYVDKEGRKHEVVTLSCALGSAKCVLFSCRLYELGAKKEATVTVTSRLWNSTLVEDYPRVDAVHVWSRARLHLPQGSLLQQSTADDLAEVQTVALPDRLDVHEPEAVPIWIIVVSVVVGLLLLVALVLLLRKLGFFKRRRPDPTLSCNLKKRDENGELT